MRRVNVIGLFRVGNFSVSVKGESRVWVDASVGDWGTGIGVVGEGGVIARKWDKRERTSLEVELLAIKEALVWVGKAGEGCFLIYTDSRLAVELLEKESIHRMVEEVRNMVGICRQNGKIVALKWTQREDEGITKADRVARGARVAVGKGDLGSIRL